MLNIKKFDWEKRVQSNIKLKQVISNKTIVSNNHPTVIIDVAVNSNNIVIALSNHYLLRWNLSVDYSMNSITSGSTSSSSTIGGISKSEYDYIDLSLIIKGICIHTYKHHHYPTTDVLFTHTYIYMFVVVVVVVVAVVVVMCVIHDMTVHDDTTILYDDGVPVHMIE